jgi:hypothetical protein
MGRALNPPENNTLRAARTVRQSTRFRLNIETSIHCFARPVLQHKTPLKPRRNNAMSSDKYDAYGEALPEAPDDRREGTATSVLLGRIGQAVFWVLVITIVAARIIYYPASPAFEVGSAGQAPLAATQ